MTAAVKSLRFIKCTISFRAKYKPFTRLQFVFCQNIAMMRLKHFQAMRQIVGLNNHVRTVVLRESVHILDEDLLLRQIFQDDR